MLITDSLGNIFDGIKSIANSIVDVGMMIVNFIVRIFEVSADVFNVIPGVSLSTLQAAGVLIVLLGIVYIYIQIQQPDYYYRY